MPKAIAIALASLFASAALLSRSPLRRSILEGAAECYALQARRIG